MPPKRKSSGPIEAPPSPTAEYVPQAKKARKGASPNLSVDKLSKIPRSDLENSTKEELVDFILELQVNAARLEGSGTKKSATTTSLTSSAQPTAEDPEKIKLQANKLAKMMASGIKKQMKWQ